MLLYFGTISEYPYASLNAFNFFSLIGANHVSYNSKLFILSYHTIGMIFIVLITAFSWFIYIKGNGRKYGFACALIQIAGVFTFSVSMHERYLFPAAILAILAYIYLKDIRILLLSFGFCITSYINTHVVLFESGNSVSYSPVLFVTSLLNVLLFSYLIKVVFDIAVKKKTVTKINIES